MRCLDFFTTESKEGAMIDPTPNEKTADMPTGSHDPMGRCPKMRRRRFISR